MRRKEISVSISVALAAGLFAGYLLFPPADGKSDSRPPKAREDTRFDTGEKPSVFVEARVSDMDAGNGWALMASEEIARRKPPEAVKDCRALHKWALAQGAFPVGNAVHTLSLSANFATDVRITSMKMKRHLLSDLEKSRLPVARLSCLPEAGSVVHMRDPGDLPTADEMNDSQSGSNEMHRVSRLKKAEQHILVNMMGTTGPFTYSLTLGLDTSIGYQKVVVDGGDRPLLGTEDGGGMGYWPAQYTWTMTPERTFTQCPEVKNVVPGQEQKCF